MLKLKTILNTSQILLPFILSYLCQRLSIGRGFDFHTTSPQILIINFILWSAVFLLLFAIFKKNYLALFFYLFFFLIFSLANRYKIKFINQPIGIYDLIWRKGTTDFISPVIKYTDLKKELIASFTILIISFFILKFLFKSEIKKWWIRVIFIIISFNILISPYLYPKFFDWTLNKTNIIFNGWDTAENCRNNGILLCFIYGQKHLKFPQPDNYHQNSISKIPIITEDKTSSNPNIKPNIILILSESLWDATKLPSNKFSSDPISYIRPDIKSTFISPTFGGATANVEFEILTGLTNYFLPTNSYPYTQYIKQSIPSLFTLFKEQNYTTTAIHPYSHWFYNRNNVYQYFGVDKFINLSNMSDYQQAGPFVSDKSFTDEIINQFNSTEKPQFIFALSIQNHAPYEPNRFSDHQIKLSNSLTLQDNSILQSYIDGIGLSNYYYQVLKQTIKNSKKPTILIFFGDHLPFLGTEYDIYKKLNFDTNNQTNLHSTPIALWSNFKTNLDINPKLSPNFLSLEILKLANISPKYQFSFINSLTDTDTVLHQKIPQKFTFQQLKNYELIQYDLIFGKQYLLKKE
jgi:phosphoglycerol transferase MdoB-like AlkP superfamily enzyme